MVCISQMRKWQPRKREHLLWEELRVLSTEWPCPCGQGRESLRLTGLSNMFNFQQPPPSRPSAGEQVNTGPAKGRNLFLWSVQQPQAPGPRPRAMENVSPPRTLLLAPGSFLSLRGQEGCRSPNPGPAPGHGRGCPSST
jgi:hypothetical protein